MNIAYYVSIENFGMKKYLEKEQNFLIIFGHATEIENFAAFFEQAQRGCQKRKLSVHINIFGETFVSEKSVFSSLSNVERSIFGLFVKFSLTGLSKLHSSCREGHFEDFFSFKL